MEVKKDSARKYTEYTDSDSLYSELSNSDEENEDDDGNDLSDVARESGESKKALRECKKENQAHLAYHTAREDEVADIWRYVQQQHNSGSKAAELSFTNARYRIYSSQWMRAWPPYLLLWHTPYLAFYKHPYPETTEEKELTIGLFYFTPGNDQQTNPFNPPKQAGREPIQLSLMRTKRTGERVSVTFLNQFVLKMEIPRDVVFAGSPDEPRATAETPEILEFVGISNKFENERTRKEKEAETKAEERREKDMSSFPSYGTYY